MEENAKMFLFGRWMSTCYDSSTLNNQDGAWWTHQLKHFNDVVYPGQIENGSVKATEDYLTIHYGKV